MRILFELVVTWSVILSVAVLYFIGFEADNLPLAFIYLIVLVFVGTVCKHEANALKAQEVMK